MERRPEEFLPLTPAVFHILLALSGGEMHGYAIMRDVDDMSGGSVRLGPGTLYRSIRRLLDEDIIEEVEERPDPLSDDERRRYYRLTQLGRAVLGAEAERLQRLLQIATSRGRQRAGETR